MPSSLGMSEDLRPPSWCHAQLACACLHAHAHGVEREVPHRKTIRHFEDRRDAHHLTFSCVDRRPLLQIHGTKELLVNSIARSIASHRFDLYAYVLMPEHVHIVVRPQHVESSVADLLQAIKRPMSFRAREMLESSGHPIAETLRVVSEGGRIVFRFWQRGPGFDSNLRSWDSVNDAVLYIHMNPVRRGLVERPEEYEWSSCRQWEFPDEAVGPHAIRVCRQKG